MSTFLFWQRWLFAVGMVITMLGILMALVSGTPLFDVFNRQIDPAFWETAAIDEAARRFQHWMYGLWGATIAGWGIFLTYVVSYPFKKKEKWARNCLIVGLLVWFVLDTSLSAICKVYFNVAFNTALLVLVMLPLVFTRKEFVRAI